MFIHLLKKNIIKEIVLILFKKFNDYLTRVTE